MTPTNEPAPLATTPPPGRIVRATQSLAHGFRQMIGAQAIPTPRVDPQLVRLSIIERSAEVLRYTLLRAEHWLSPGGTLRAALRLSLKLALLIGIPVLTVGPVVLLLLEGAAAASTSLATMAANLAAMSHFAHHRGPRLRRADRPPADIPPQEVTNTPCGFRAGCASACPAPCRAHFSV